MTLALPWLESRQAWADATPPPRFVLVFTPNGTLQNQWWPADATALSPLLDPLMAHRARFTVVGNLDMRSASLGSGDGHQKGIGHVFTARPLQSGSLFGSVDWASGPSIDQRVAEVIGGTTPLTSLELGVQVPGARVYDRMIYRAAGRPLPPVVDPRETFARLFGASTDPAAAAAHRQRRKSVLDAVLDEFNRTRSAVSQSDALRLDAHAATIRELEQRLDALPVPLAACVRPTEPQVPSLTDGTQYPHLGELQTDLLVLALACGITRVASLQWSSAASPVVFSWLGQTVDHHELSHRADGDADAQLQLQAINRWYAAQFSRLLDGLTQAREGAGSLLDNTVVIWGNELGKGNVHSHESVPFIVAGNVQNRLVSGVNLDAAHASHAQVLLAGARACGLTDVSFGDPSLGAGVLPGLLA